MTKPRVGVVGVGRFGQNHSRIYSELPFCDFIGIYDINRERGEEISQRDNVPLFSDFNSLLNAVDFISVVTPTSTHFEVAAKALEAGKHTLVEKPVAAQPEQARRMIELSRKKGVDLRVGHLERFNAALVSALGEVKDPQFISCQRLGSWVGRQVTVDVISDLMIHDLDILKILDVSALKSVKASGKAVVSQFPDHTSTWLEFESGLKAYLTADRVSSRRFREIIFYCKNTILCVDMMNQGFKKSLISATDNSSFSDIVYHDIPVTSTEPLKEELTAFLRRDDSTIAGGKDGLEALELALTILEAVNEA